jgi:hypothetical protein
VFVAELYPALPEVAPSFDGRFPVDLYLYGPSGATEINLQRKITKRDTYKNWRLNGETIHDPTNESGRFSGMESGDLALFEFNDGAYPIRVRTVLLSRTDPIDAESHVHLDALLIGKSMIAISREQLQMAVRDVALADDHPLRDLLLDADLEDAAEGGAVGRERLRNRKSGRRVLRTELLAAKRQAEENGQKGEEFVNAYLQLRAGRAGAVSFQWEANENAVAPYDFTVGTETDRVCIDVKSTSGDFNRTIHVSLAELECMAHAVKYDIYRVYAMSETAARMRVASDLKNFATRILSILETLPDGVVADGVSIRPDFLQFGSEIALYMNAEESGPDQPSVGA